MTAKFRVGDWVRISSTLTSRDLREIGIDGNIDEYVGKVDKVEYDDGEYYRLENCGKWFPGSMLELVDEGVKPRIDQCSITLKMVDGSCVIGSMGITRKEFEELWDRFIVGRVG